VNDLAMRATVLFFTLLLTIVGMASANAQQQLLHQERSLYRNIFVTQNGDERCMLFRYPRPFGREILQASARTDQADLRLHPDDAGGAVSQSEPEADSHHR